MQFETMMGCQLPKAINHVVIYLLSKILLQNELKTKSFMFLFVWLFTKLYYYSFQCHYSILLKFPFSLLFMQEHVRKLFSFYLCYVYTKNWKKEPSLSLSAESSNHDKNIFVLMEAGFHILEIVSNCELSSHWSF